MAAETLMADRDHFTGCPVVLTPEKAAGRVERYTVTRAMRPNAGGGLSPAGHVRVTRCQQCGAALYEDLDGEVVS